MSANPIIYCLENLTDYLQFERLCSDLMAGIGFINIEPIGGTGDKGRDAVHISRDDGKLTIFAYTVRSDWFTKLMKDCERIKEVNHNPSKVIFVCTSSLSGTDRDLAREKVKSKFNWDLDIYDLERIRVLLSVNLRYLLARHPTIFCAPWFPTKGGLALVESKDTLIIDHLLSDHSLAIWLARRLSVAGYRTWCYGTSPLVGEDRDDSIKALIDCRASGYLPIISQNSFTDSDFIGRISYASRATEVLLPCWSSNMNDLVSKSKILQVEPARFHSGWSVGLASILRGLEVRGVNAQFDLTKGQAIALQAYMPEPLTKLEIEKVYTNVFSVTVPKSIMIFELSREFSDQEIEELRSVWAFIKVSSLKFLAFESPPTKLPLINLQRIPEYSWESFSHKEGRSSVNAVKELIKRSLELACVQAGLVFCSDRSIYYFSDDAKQKNIPFTHVDGRSTRVAMTGVVQDGWGDRATKVRYQLSPIFQVVQDEEGLFWVTTKIYVRVTDVQGNPFTKKDIVRKRKKVTKNWWNKQWLARTIGAMQAIANTDGKTFIEVGLETNRKVIVSTKPLEWDCPISIDVEAVDRIGDFQAEIASIRSLIEDEDVSSESQNLGELSSDE